MANAVCATAAVYWADHMPVSYESDAAITGQTVVPFWLMRITLFFLLFINLYYILHSPFVCKLTKLYLCSYMYTI